MEDDDGDTSCVCNYSYFSPRKDELRFIPDCDLVSSEDTDSENDSRVSKPQKFNQLNPRPNIVFKLLNSIRPQFGNTWETVYTEDDSSMKPNSDLINNVDSHIVHSSKMVQSSTKRRREVASDEELSEHENKRVKRHSSNGWQNKSVNRKQQSHSLSASESDSSEDHLSNKKQVSGKPNGHNKVDNNKNICNGQFSNDEGNRLSDQEFDVNTENSNISNNFNENTAHSNKQSGSEEDIGSCEDANSDNSFIKPNPPKQQSNIVGVRSNLESTLREKRNEIQEKFCRAPKLTEEDQEEISKFSSLLSNSLLEKNNIWILQCPAQMDCSALVNQRLNLNGCSQLTVGDSMFEAYSYRDRQGKSATLAVPSDSNHFQLCQVPISGTITVEETVQLNSKAKIYNPDPPSCVELPENLLQKRHPLLGLEYEEQPKTAPRLSPKKKKKRQKKEIDGLQDQSLESPEENKIKRKKKKKHHSDDSN